MKFTGFQLAIQHPEKTVAFYTQVLGMTLHNTEEYNNCVIYTLRFADTKQQLQLLYKRHQSLSSYTHEPRDNYWKFSIFVNDIQAFYQHLTAKKHPISEPHQFADVGYLAHTVDTENHQIELIQKTFKNSPPNPTLHSNHVLGLLTLRTRDPMPSIRLFEEVLTMKLHVRMQVASKGGFSLYFLGDKRLTPPSSDIDAPENREWLYQQDHLFIELQHHWGSQHDPDFTLNCENKALQQLHFSGNLGPLTERLNHYGTAFKQTAKQIHLKTIDRHIIVVN